MPAKKNLTKKKTGVKRKTIKNAAPKMAKRTVKRTTKKTANRRGNVAN